MMGSPGEEPVIMDQDWEVWGLQKGLFTYFFQE